MVNYWHTGNPTMTDDHAAHLRRGSLGGEDFAVPVGTPLYAPTAGLLRFRIAGTGGGTLSLLGDDGNLYEAMHCSSSPFTLGGAALRVSSRQFAGASGGAPGHYLAGSSTGPHVHEHYIRPDGVRRPISDLLLGTAGSITPTNEQEEADMLRILVVADAKNGRVVKGQRFYQGPDQVLIPLTKRQYEIDHDQYPGARWTEWTGDDIVNHAKNVGLMTYEPDLSVRGGVGKLTGPVVYDL